jgi:hypothetical protein
VQANLPTAGAGETPVMPVTMSCPMMAPVVVDAAVLLNSGGAAIYNGYSTGNPVANRVTPDLLAFAGDSVNTSTGTQRWTWSMTGAGQVTQ